MATYEDMQKQLLNNYVDLLEIQYHNKPKAIDTIKANCEILLANMLMWKIEKECLNVDLSVGVQLDILGKWVGVDRYIGKQTITQRYYSYYDWNTTPNDLQGCLQDWNNPTEENAPFITYPFIVSLKETINDNDFRFLIKLKIIKNNINATCKNIDDEIYNLFKDLVYTTWCKYDNSDFVVVGTPTISDTGVLTGATSSNYVRSNSLSLSTANKISVACIIRTPKEKDTPFVNTYWWLSNNFYFSAYNKETLCVFNTVGMKGTGYRLFKYEKDTKYYIKFDVDLKNNNQTLFYKNLKTGQINVANSQNVFNALSDAFLRVGVWGQYNMKYGDIDLSSISVSLDDKQVVSGSVQTPMNMTYNYKASQNAIIQIANEKNCLPAPTGVKINLREIT